jgi:hypothetical protein
LEGRIAQNHPAFLFIGLNTFFNKRAQPFCGLCAFGRMEKEGLRMHLLALWPVVDCIGKRVQ